MIRERSERAQRASAHNGRYAAPTCCCCRPLPLCGPSAWRQVRLSTATAGGQSGTACSSPGLAAAAVAAPAAARVVTATAARASAAPAALLAISAAGGKCGH